MGHHGYRRHVRQLQSSERHFSVTAAVIRFLRGTIHLSVRPTNLIRVSSLLTQQLPNGRVPRVMCAHVVLCLYPRLRSARPHSSYRPKERETASCGRFWTGKLLLKCP